MTPRRRHDDPSPDITAEQADEFIGGLPQTIRELKRGRRQNRWIALGTAAALLLFGYMLDQQQDELAETQHDTCLLMNKNARAVNSAVDTAIESIRLNDTFTPTEKRRRINAWEQVRQGVPVCQSSRAEDK